MTIHKPEVLPPWADTAVPTTDIVKPADSFITAGWPLSSTPPSRQYFNWALNYTMNGVRYFARTGVSDWDGAETYANHDVARGSDGLLYRSLQGSNLNNGPAGSPSWWGAIATLTATAGDNSSSIATTAFVTTAFGNKANVSGNYPLLSVGFATSAGTAATAASAGSAGSVPWTGVGGKPTTVAGYAITDAITTAGGQAIGGSLYLAGGDFAAWRAGGTTGVINLNQALTAYVYFDGANMQISAPGGNLFLNGQLIQTANAIAATYLSLTGAANTYLSQAAAASTYVSKAAIIIAADPGTVPSGSPGQIFWYY